MSDSKYDMYQWKAKKEYYTENNGEIIFKDDTPDEILQSYRLWQDQIKRLNEFPTKRGQGLFSFLDHSKPGVKKTEPSLIGTAKTFFKNRSEGTGFDHSLFNKSFIFIDSKKRVYSSVSNIPLDLNEEYTIQECFKKSDSIVILWTTASKDMVTVFWFDKNSKISKIQEFICTNQ